MADPAKIKWHAALDPRRHRCSCGCGEKAVSTQFPNGADAMPTFAARHIINENIAAHRAAKVKETT